MASDENLTEDRDVDEFSVEETEGWRPFLGINIGRVIAVAFFLLLGMFAVIHSLTRGPVQAEGEHADQAHAAAESQLAASQATSESPQDVGKKTAAAVVKALPPAQPISSVAPTKVTATGISTANKTAFRPLGNANGSKLATETSRFKPPTAPRTLQANAGAPPIARLAQAPGRPLGTSTQGFGELVKKNTTANSFAAPPQASGRFPSLPTRPNTSLPSRPVSALIKRSGNEAQQLLGDIAQSSRNLRDTAADKLAAAGSSLENLAVGPGKSASARAPSLRSNTNPFGSPPKVNTSFAPPQKPSTSNSFGDVARRPAGSASNARPNDQFALPPRQPTAPVKARGDFDDLRSTKPLPRRQPTNFTSTAGRSASPTVVPIQTEASNSRRRLPARPASTASSPRFPGRIGNASRPTIPQANRRSGPGVNSGPVSRLASAITSNLPGEKRLDGVQAPSMTIEKFSPREVQVNQPADFQIVIRNVGRVPVTNVQVFDQIPVGTEFLEANPKPSQVNNQQLSWAIGTVAPGTEKRIELKLKPTKPGEIGSVAQMTFATQSSMRTRVTQPVLEITHRTAPQVMIGGDVMFDVVVTNRGDGPARNVMIQEDIPNQLNFREGFREIEYEVGTLLPNQSRNVRLALTAKQAGKLQNVIHATGSGGLQSQHKLEMEVVSPKLKAKSDGPTRRFLGRRAQHQFSVSNGGTAAATNVDFIARLPRGLRYVSSNNKGTYDANSHAVLWELAELQRGVTADVEIMTEPIAIGSQPIKFEVNADLNLTDTVEQPLSVEHLVDVFFDIDDVVDPIEIGSETRYRVQVVNQGTKAATNVRLQIDFPAGLKPTTVDGPLDSKINGQQVLFTPITSLKPGERIQFVVSGAGQTAGDHRVVMKMQTDGRSTPVAKEESTRVYSDR